MNQTSLEKTTNDKTIELVNLKTILKTPTNYNNEITITENKTINNLQK
jgi:hypothetical protein